MTKSPKIFDPYLGTMWGNILDMYDNPTYSLKLYLKPEVAAAATGTASSQSTGAPAAQSGDQARQDNPATDGIVVTAKKEEDKKVVVLAQTGVTGTQIDNVEIDGYVDPSSTTADVGSARGKFTIIQPGAANFLDQIQWARKYLGASDDKLGTPDFVMYLDINFYGYSHDPDDNEEGGEPIQIIGTTTYKMTPKSIGVKVDNTGSRYDFEVGIGWAPGYADNVFKLQQTTKISGKTITELFKSLEKQLNLQLEEQSTQYDNADKIRFNLNKLVKGNEPLAGAGGGAAPAASTATATAASPAPAAASTTTRSSSRSSVSGTLTFGKPSGPITYNGRVVNPGDSDYAAAGQALMAQQAALQQARREMADPLLAFKSTTGADASLDLLIKDESIPNVTNSQNVETTTRQNFEPAPDKASELRRDADGASTAGASQEKVNPGVTLTLSESDSFFNIIGKILSMNKEFQSKATRKTNLNDPGNNEVKDDKTFISWYDVHCEIKNIKWDKKRNAYAKEYIYTPFLINDARSDVALTTKEFDYLKEKDSFINSKTDKRPLTALATKRLQDIYSSGALSKSYFYIFTGLNDQIINLDINYNMGVALLMPPKGGMIGDFSVTSGPAKKNSASINEDMTLGNKLEAAKKEADKGKLIDVFKQIKGLANNINGLAQSLGRTVDEINAAVTDATGATAKRLAQSIDGATLNSTLKKIGASEGGDPTDVPGPSTQITVENRGAYAPDVSGFLYADDFIIPGGNITSEEIESAGLIAFDSKGVLVSHGKPIEKSVPSPLSGMTSDGPASVLMGYTYRARNSTNFLMNIDLTLRGDPYWLTNYVETMTEPTDSGSKRDRTSNPPPSGAKYYFLLTIGTPSKFDFNLEDEDNNSGYWQDGRVSGTFSGLYFPSRWVNKFNNGIFTTEMKAHKEISVPLQWIRRVAPGETPPDWDKLEANSANVELFVATSAATSVTPEPGSPVTSNPTQPNPTGFRNPLGDASYTVGDGLGAGRNHGGVDLQAAAGTPVYATKGGTVIVSGEVSGYGQVVYIDHGDGTQTRYGHLQDGSRTLTAGSTVTGGQVIGKVGSTGRSTGNHLHYEVRTGKSGSAANADTTPVDASKYLGR